MIERMPHGEQQEENFQKSVIYDLQIAKSDWWPVSGWRRGKGSAVRTVEGIAGGRSDGLSVAPRALRAGQVALRGVALSVATDQNGGFSDEQCELIGSLVPALALAAFRVSVARSPSTL